MVGRGDQAGHVSPDVASGSRRVCGDVLGTREGKQTKPIIQLTSWNNMVGRGGGGRHGTDICYQVEDNGRESEVCQP